MGARLSTDPGFTLVELMVVVLIIGILVTVAVPVYQNASAQAQIKGCQANQRIISGAIDLYKDTNPGATFTAGRLASGGSGWYAALIPGWIKAKPVCSQGETEYLLDTDGTVLGDQNATVGFKAGHAAP